MRAYHLVEMQRTGSHDERYGPTRARAPDTVLGTAMGGVWSGPSPTPLVAGVAAADLFGHHIGDIDVLPRDFSRTNAAGSHRALSRLGYHPDPGVGAPTVTVQRCGATPCNCSPEERAAHEDSEQARVGPEGGPLGAALAQRIQASRGQGAGLEERTQASFEGAFGHNFANVRIHADGEADALSRSLGAVAFTTGADLFFRAGAYQPGSPAGDRLLAHELTHVVQQRSMDPTGGLTIGPAGDAYEQEADNAAAHVDAVGQASVLSDMNSYWAPATAGQAVQRTAVQRQGAPDPQDPFGGHIQHQDPAMPDTNDKGMTCGTKDGKFTCEVDPGKGDPLELPGDWSNFGPPTPSQPGLKGPSDCPPGAYNRLWNSCCPAGTQVDDSGMNCIPLPPLPAPAPPEPDQPGDYPLSDPNQDVQVA